MQHNFVGRCHLCSYKGTQHYIGAHFPSTTFAHMLQPPPPPPKLSSFEFFIGQSCLGPSSGPWAELSWVELVLGQCFMNLNFMYEHMHRNGGERINMMCLFDLILYLFFTSHQQSFSYVGTGLHGLNQY